MALADDLEIVRYFHKHGLCAVSRRAILNARFNAPRRAPYADSSDYISYFESFKMGRVVAAERRTTSFPAMLSYELNQDVFEFHPQPMPLHLPRNIAGLPILSLAEYWPDFLVLSNEGAVLEDWYDSKRIGKLMAKYPGRLMKAGNIWRIPDAEIAAAALGASFRLRNIDELGSRFMNNLSTYDEIYRALHGTFKSVDQSMNSINEG